MSRIKVDEICNFAENGAVSAIEGLTIPSGKKLTVVGARTIASATATGTEGESAGMQTTFTFVLAQIHGRELQSLHGK